MRRFEVSFVDGGVEIIEAAGCWPNDWAVAFVYEDARPSKSFNARPGDTVKTYQTFRVISGRLLNGIREIA